jgi:hypothetical protein
LPSIAFEKLLKDNYTGSDTETEKMTSRFCFKNSQQYWLFKNIIAPEQYEMITLYHESRAQNPCLAHKAERLLLTPTEMILYMGLLKNTRK